MMYMSAIRKLLYPISSLIALLVFLGLAQSCAPRDELALHRNIAYPRSELIRKFEWTAEPSKYPGTGSDMHWWTWGIDSNVYVVDDDGQNFRGPSWYAHLLRVTGVPPHHQVSTVTDFSFYDFRLHIPNDFMRRYVCGIVAVDSSIYISIYDYDWNIPGKTIHADTLRRRIRVYNPWYDMDSVLAAHMGFVDAYSKHGGVAGIIVSRDLGRTWQNLPDEHTSRFFSERFGAPAFLTFGPGNRDTPPALEPFVYAISNDGNWASGDNIFLGRVHRDSILERKAWKFYAGEKDAIVQWVPDENRASPIFTDPGHVGHPTITYHPVLKRYILSVASDVVPHRVDASPEEVKTWNWKSELQLYEGKNPWGPWSIFHNDPQWGGPEHTCYLMQMPSPWLSADGKSGTALFAGDYVNRKGEYYAFMTQPFRMILY